MRSSDPSAAARSAEPPAVSDGSQRESQARDEATEGSLRLGRVRAAGAIALLAAILLLRSAGPSGQWLFDAYQRLSPRAQGSPRVAIVQIDPASIQAQGAWPWPRARVAELVARIGDAGAAAIGIDAQFAEPDRLNPESVAALYPKLAPSARATLVAQPSMDVLFGEQVGRNPVVLARLGVTPDSSDYAGASTLTAANTPIERPIEARLPPGVLRFPRFIANIPDLDDNVRGLGIINGKPDPDGVVRRVPLVADVGGIAMPGFAMELARVGSGAKAIVPLVRHGRMRAVRLGRRTIPTGPDGTMLLHFADAPARAIPAALILNPRPPPLPPLFGGKIVLIGLATAGTSDIVTTPIDQRAYGMTVQAQAIESILAGEALARPRWADAAEWALGIALALGVILGGPRLRGVSIVVVPALAAVVVAATSWFAFLAGGRLLDPTRPLILLAAAGSAVIVTLFAEAGRERRRLGTVLARSAGELNAARAVQLGMLPPRDRLQALHARVDIDALIEPARLVGGDLYDAFVLDDGRVCFLIGDVTGKGMPAALFMAISKSQAQSVFRLHRTDLGRAMAELNVRLARDNSEDLFVTMLVGILDVASGRVELCNAGHENPLRVARDGAVAELPMEGGPPLCVADGYPYETERVTLAPGEALVIVTDGVTEAQDLAGGFFGHERLAAELRGWTAERPASAAGEALVRAVRAFEGGGEPSDDVTVLLLRYRGPDGADG